MSDILPIGQTNLSTGATTNAEKARNKTAADFETFLKLLVTQLKQQDPTQPTDSKEFLAQLAAFSSVEQQVQTNAHLEDVIGLNSHGWAIGLIGKSVVSSDGKSSGIVESIIVDGNGPRVILDNGDEIAVGHGVIIAAGVPGEGW